MINLRIILLLIFATTAVTIKAQERKVGLMISGNYINNYNENGYKIGELKPAIVYKDKGGSFHNLEIISLNVQRNYEKAYDSSGNEIGKVQNRDIDLGIRYQYNMPLISGSEKLIPYVGFSGMFRYVREEGQIVNTQKITDDFRNFIVKPGINPGLMIVMKDKYFVDFSVPLELEFDWQKGLQGVAEPFKEFELTQEYLKELDLKLGFGVFL